MHLKGKKEKILMFVHFQQLFLVINS